jgi:acyl carrier protein
MSNVTEQTAPIQPTPAAAQAALAEMWCDLLTLSEVHEDDDFFKLGGNSLAAIKLLQRVEKKFGPDALTPETLYADPRFGSVAKAIDEAVAA